MARIDTPVARPREISSRSANDNRSAQRSRAVGRRPPASAMNFRSDEFCRPKCLAMRLTGTPASRMSQIVFLSSSENRATPTPPDRQHQMLANQDTCCVDQLRTHRIGGVLCTQICPSCSRVPRARNAAMARPSPDASHPSGTSRSYGAALPTATGTEATASESGRGGGPCRPR
jgi:hypothetical protein